MEIIKTKIKKPNQKFIYKKQENNDLNLQDFTIYGSSRLGILNINQKVIDLPNVIDNTNPVQTKIGMKYFELSNHASAPLSTGLGNVLTTISDRKIEHGSGSTVDYYTADTCIERSRNMISATDYYPFGFAMDERNYSPDDYKYGFNGKEKDSPGMGGGGSTYDYGFRIYNPSIAKFLSVDPLFKSYPWYTPYQFAGNKPIVAIDLDGLEEKIVIYSYTKTDNGFNLVSDCEHVYDNVGPLGYGTMYLYIVDGKFQKTINFKRTPADFLKNIFNNTTTPNINKVTKLLGNLISGKTGLLIFGSSKDGKDSPGKKTKDYFGTFDFDEFMDIMNLATNAVKTKDENSLDDLIESLEKEVKELIMENRKNEPNEDDDKLKESSEQNNNKKYKFVFTVKGKEDCWTMSTYSNSTSKSDSTEKAKEIEGDGYIILKVEEKKPPKK